MDVIDDEGRLFGAVNVVDALVVLVVLAVVVAGGVFVLGGGEAETRYATVDLGGQPGYVIDAVESGDVVRPDGTPDNLTVTDTYVYDVSDEDGEETSADAGLLVRVEINGQRIEREELPDRFEFRGAPVRVGRTLALETSDYEVEGDVTRLEPSGTDLPTAESAVVVETRVSPSALEEIESGDELRVAGNRIGEVAALEAFPTADTESDRRYVLLGLELETVERGGEQQFGTQRIAVDAPLSVSGDAYSVSGTIVQRGDSEIATEATPLVLQTTVPTSVAEDVRAGDEYRIGEVPIVSVASVTTYATGNPETTRLVLGVEARAQRNGELRFGEREVRVGSSMPIRTGDYDIDTEVIRTGTLDEPGERTTRTATVRIDNVRPDRADDVQRGLVEETRSGTTAVVQGVDSQPAEVVLESEDGDIFLREHPRNLDLELTVELTVQERPDGTLRYRGETLQTGTTVTFEFGTATVTGKVTGLE